METKKTVTVMGKRVSFDAAVAMMDAKILKEVKKLGIKDAQEFVEEYSARHYYKVLTQFVVA